MTAAQGFGGAVASEATTRAQTLHPLTGDRRVLDTDTGRPVETRRDGPAPVVPVLTPTDGDRHG